MLLRAGWALGRGVCTGWSCGRLVGWSAGWCLPLRSLPIRLSVSVPVCPRAHAPRCRLRLMPCRVAAPGELESPSCTRSMNVRASVESGEPPARPLQHTAHHLSCWRFQAAWCPPLVFAVQRHGAHSTACCLTRLVMPSCVLFTLCCLLGAVCWDGDEEGLSPMALSQTETHRKVGGAWAAGDVQPSKQWGTAWACMPSLPRMHGELQLLIDALC